MKGRDVGRTWMPTGEMMELSNWEGGIEGKMGKVNKENDRARGGQIMSEERREAEGRTNREQREDELEAINQNL